MSSGERTLALLAISITGACALPTAVVVSILKVFGVI